MSDINVLVAMDFSDDIIAQLRAVSPRLKIERHFPDVPPEAYEQADVLYTASRFPTPEQAPRLRWIQMHTAGMDRALEKAIVQRANVTVTSMSGIHARQIANYCLMMLLAFNYKLPDMFREQAQSLWRERPHEHYLPKPLHEQTLGIVGYGTIGREIARVCAPLGLHILASKRDAKRPAESAQEYTPAGTGDPEGEIPERIYPAEALASMAKECDYLIVTVPATPQTRHLINAHILSHMKPSAFLINIARGELVDEPALIHALQQGTLGGAALDVFEQEPLPSSSPLWQLPNVIISPHISGNSTQYHALCAEVFVTNLQRYLEERPLLNVLNKEVGY